MVLGILIIEPDSLRVVFCDYYDERLNDEKKNIKTRFLTHRIQESFVQQKQQLRERSLKTLDLNQFEGLLSKKVLNLLKYNYFSISSLIIQRR